MQPCTQKDRIESIEQMVTKLDKTVNGNGNTTGLSKQMPVIIERMGTMAEKVDKLATSVSAFVKFQVESQSKEEAQRKIAQVERDHERELQASMVKAERYKVHSRWVIGTLIVIILTGITLLITLL